MKNWLILQAEIDFLYFLLSEMKENLPKSGLEQMIDDSTGYSKTRLKKAKTICSKMKKLKKKMTKETNVEYDTEMEDAILNLK